MSEWRVHVWYKNQYGSTLSTDVIVTARDFYAAQEMVRGMFPSCTTAPIPIKVRDL